MPPRLSAESYDAEVSEDVENNTAILTFHAIDDDSGANGLLTFHLDPSDVPFRVDSRSGVLTVFGTLDREVTAEYFFAIVVSDNGTVPLIDRANVTVVVLDVNDNGPNVQESWVVAITENSAVPEVLLSLGATDPDGGLNGTAGLFYTLGNSNNQTVLVDRSTGDLILARRLDRETLACFVVTVVVADAGNRTASAAVRIVVEDVNDNSPHVDGGVAERVFNVSEFSPLGRLTTFSVSDPDSGPNGTVAMSLSGELAPYFDLDRTSGDLYLLRIDYEERSSLEVTMTAVDGGIPPRSVSVVVRVNVIDENDHSPTARLDTHRDIVWIPANLRVGGEVVRIEAFDADSGLNGALSFTVSSVSAEVFEARGDGFVVLRDRYVLEPLQSFNVSVIVSDAGTPRRSTVLSFNVKVSEAVPLYQISVENAFARRGRVRQAGPTVHAIGFLHGSGVASLSPAVNTLEGESVSFRRQRRVEAGSISARPLQRTVYRGDPVVLVEAIVEGVTPNALVVPAVLEMILRPQSASGNISLYECSNVSASCAPRSGATACLLSATVPIACFGGEGVVLVGTVSFANGRRGTPGAVGPIVLLPSYSLPADMPTPVAIALPAHDVSSGNAFEVELWINGTLDITSFDLLLCFEPMDTSVISADFNASELAMAANEAACGVHIAGALRSPQSWTSIGCHIESWCGLAQK